MIHSIEIGADTKHGVGPKDSAKAGPSSKVLPWPKPEQQRLFEDDMAELRRDLARLAEREHAANTRRTYAADWRDFEGFCRLAGSGSLPALPVTVALYLAYEARIGRALATIEHRLSAITAVHRSHGLATPCTPDVGLALRQLRREMGASAKPKTPLSVEHLTAMLSASGETPRGLRDRALLLVGFGSGCRRSELAALDLADVTFTPEGFVLHIARSKTDQEAKGREVPVHRGERAETCPVRALQQWLTIRGNWAGALFAHVLKSGSTDGKRLVPRAIARVVQKSARRAGLDPLPYAGHSLRSGCATAAAAGGADILSIARRLGHKSLKSTQRYVRHGSLFAVNPLKGVL